MTCRVLPYPRRDFLITCALLHDIGKLEEMHHGLDAGEFTGAGTLVGHTVSGAYLIGSAADTIESFPNNLKHGLMHMILSHHGSREWGAAETPSCGEAFILHGCDRMSAASHGWRKAAEKAAPGQYSVRVGLGEYYYVGDLGLQEPPPSIAAPPLPVATRSFFTYPQPEVVRSFVTTCLPVRGMVAAGSPDQSSEEDQETREVTIQRGSADYLLEVVGDSMADAGIDAGDLLFIKCQTVPEDRDIVVAYVDHAGDVVKRFYRDSPTDGGGGCAWLMSENKAQNYPPLVVDSETVLRGKVVGVLKKT
jgi:SOS-response transcriptional repressor LexA